MSSSAYLDERSAKEKEKEVVEKGRRGEGMGA